MANNRGLKWQPHEYYTGNLLKNKELTLEEMQQEYNRLRQVANARLKRLGKSEFRRSQAYKENRKAFEKTARHYSKTQLAKKLYQASKFVGSEQGSLRGQRRIQKRTIEALHEHGYEFINKKNFRKFSQFMEEMRVRAGGRLLDSDRVAEVFGVTQNLGVDPKNLQTDFEWWSKNVAKLKEVPKLKGKRHTSKEYKQLLSSIDKYLE